MNFHEQRDCTVCTLLPSPKFSFYIGVVNSLPCSISFTTVFFFYFIVMGVINCVKYTTGRKASGAIP